MHFISILLLGLAAGCLVVAVSRNLYSQLILYFQEISLHTQLRLESLLLFIDIRNIWLLILSMSAVVSGFTFFLGNSFSGSLLVFFLSIFLSNGAIRLAIQRRQQKFIAQLPQALFSLASILKAGSSLNSAILRLQYQLDSPMADEIGLINRQMRLGMPVDQCFDNLYHRVPREEVLILTCLLKIAMRTGGSVADIIEAHAYSQQAVQQLKEKAYALTAQARLQGWVMALMPWLMLLALTAISPALSSYFYKTKVGIWVLMVIVLLDILGIFFIRQILRTSGA